VAERSGLVARQTGQRVIGVVENMTGELFGSGGGDDLARRLSTDGEPVTVLARIPLSVPLRVGGDTGQPIVLTHPDDPAAVAIAGLAEKLATRSRGLAGRSLPVQPR
jgi:ATP-binding protein involved in chromosome partitioning